MAADIVRPTTAAEVVEAVLGAVSGGRRMEIRGGGSKALIGAPRDVQVLELAGLAGCIDYDPPELVLTARAGTPLAEIEALVAAEGQMLAFEPFDHGPLFGHAAGKATLGGVVAAGVAGSRRLSAGGARDHLLGFQAVSGRGELFAAGGKVVKNVTGYDLPKLAAGSWGRLFALTELTLKVLPRGRDALTVGLDGLDPATAQSAMAQALGSPADVQAAAHLPEGLEGRPLTFVRLEGFTPSIAARRDLLARLWSAYGPLRGLDVEEAAAAWAGVRELPSLPVGLPLWRVNTPPSGGPRVLQALESFAPRWAFDWAGGLLWLATDAPASGVRAAAEAGGGHALLVRGPADLRSVTSAFHPPPRGVAALEGRLRAAFDPCGVFETGRFLDQHLAD